MLPSQIRLRLRNERRRCKRKNRKTIPGLKKIPLPPSIYNLPGLVIFVKNCIITVRKPCKRDTQSNPRNARILVTRNKP
jgi:hypothetical protein